VTTQHSLYSSAKHNYTQTSQQRPNVVFFFVFGTENAFYFLAFYFSVEKDAHVFGVFYFSVKKGCKNNGKQ